MSFVCATVVAASGRCTGDTKTWPISICVYARCLAQKAYRHFLHEQAHGLQTLSLGHYLVRVVVVDAEMSWLLGNSLSSSTLTGFAAAVM